MTRRGVVVVSALMLAGSAALSWGLVSWLFVGPAARAEALAEQVEASAGLLEQRVARLRKSGTGMEEVLARSFGRDAGQTEHWLRLGVRAVARSVGFGDEAVVIDSGRPRSEANPVTEASYASSTPASGALSRRKFKDELWHVQGNVRAVGTIDQAVRLVAALSGQPWVHRVDSVSLKPVSVKERERFEVVVVFRSLMVEGGRVASGWAEGVEVASADVAVGSALERMSLPNRFKKPPEPEPVVIAAVEMPAENAPPSVEPPPPPPPIRYDLWQVTGVARSARQGELVFVRERESGVTRMIAPGEKLVIDGGRPEGTVVFGGAVEGDQTRVVVVINERAFEVRVGDHLGQRRPRG